MSEHRYEVERHKTMGLFGGTSYYYTVHGYEGEDPVFRLSKPFSSISSAHREIQRHIEHQKEIDNPVIVHTVHTANQECSYCTSTGKTCKGCGASV